MFSGDILTKVHTTDDNWTDWARLPGGGVTDAAIAAGSVSDQLYPFVKGVNDRAPYWHVRRWYLELVERDSKRRYHRCRLR